MKHLCYFVFISILCILNINASNELLISKVPSDNSIDIIKTSNYLSNLFNDEFKIKLNDKGVIIFVERNQRASRPAGNIKGHAGDHTTPFISFVHMVENNVLGDTTEEAVNNLRLLLESIKIMPGYETSLKSVKKDTNDWIKWAKSVKKPLVVEVEKMMSAVLSIRNRINLSAYLNKKSTGGNNEANTAGGLDAAEDSLRKGKNYGNGNAYVNVFNTFDYNAPPEFRNNVAEMWANLLIQHMISMTISYPILFNGDHKYNFDGMVKYLFNTELQDVFKDVKLRNEIKGLITSKLKKIGYL